MKKYCEYIRVSTQKQGRSGLGLEAQKEINRKHVESVGGEIIAAYKDVESGTHRNRPGLWNAIEFCKKNDCILIVAKLDRLARDVEFVFKVVNEKIDIHFCDMPVVNTMILGVFASVAQYERELTSLRTKAALAEKRKQGYRLGNKKGVDTGKANEASALARRERARNNMTNRTLWGMFCECRRANNMSADDFMRISNLLNTMGMKTNTGLNFTPKRTRSIYHKLKQIYPQNN